MSYKFQVNLGSIIELLSSHLYSGPQVYLRELLQNSVDAIQARRKLTPDFEAEIHAELLSEHQSTRPTLVFHDNGIGLTEEEVHRFLATIGKTSKQSDFLKQRDDYLGQFGIGLLACFLVSDEIVVHSRSAKPDAPAIEWRGRYDGTYQIQHIERELEIGTSVFLRCKPGAEDYFRFERVHELLHHFGSLLPESISLSAEGESWQVNDDPPPWRQHFDDEQTQKEAMLEYGQKLFDTEFFDCIPLRSKSGGVEGIAFILPYSPSPSARRTHRIYIKNMLLSENAENILPEWAFFVRCVLNAEHLQPSPSREAFQEDTTLFATQDELGECLCDYLLELAETNPQRMQKLIYLHDLSLKALALQDDEFYKLFIEWFPFETTLGTMTLDDYRAEHPIIQYTVRIDQFRQIARIAAAQSMCIINGSYIYDADLLNKLSDSFPHTQIELVNASSLTQHFEDLDPHELEHASEFIALADDALAPYQCAVALKKFNPKELPTMYSSNADSDFQRNLEQTKAIANMLWSSVLNSLSEEIPTTTAQLCFNYDNPLVRKLVEQEDVALLDLTIQMLYVQALLLGHHPLSSQEMMLLNTGLLDLIEWSIDGNANDEAPGSWSA